MYYPDFIAEQVLKKGKTVNWIIETKGYEDENVQYKDAETENWCSVATKHTGIEWRYMKVPDTFFKGLKIIPITLDTLVTLLIKYNKRNLGEKLF